MNSINLDPIRVGAAPLGVGDETLVAQTADDKKIITSPGVTVSTAFDALIDKLARETEKSLDNQSRNRLTLATQTLAVRAGITNAAQLAALEACDEYLNAILTDQESLEKEEAELKRLNKELEEAKKRASSSEKGTQNATGSTVEELEKQIAACEDRIAALQTNIVDNCAKLSAALAKLDDKSTRVLAASVRVASTTNANYLECVRKLQTDENDPELAALDAFARLLGGDDIEKILLEELGIRA